jgi:peptidoglycan DL-endopeptidase CwlO
VHATPQVDRAPARTVVTSGRPVARGSRSSTRRAPQPSIPVTAGGGSAAAVVAFVLAQVGKRYVHGASGPSAYDCSGLTMAAWALAGVRLPHGADAQRGYGRAVTRAQLQPGDLIFYPGHVGISVGGGMMVAAATQREGVRLQTIYGTPIAYRRLG